MTAIRTVTADLQPVQMTAEHHVTFGRLGWQATTSERILALELAGRSMHGQTVKAPPTHGIATLDAYQPSTAQTNEEPEINEIMAEIYKMEALTAQMLSALAAQNALATQLLHNPPFPQLATTSRVTLAGYLISLKPTMPFSEAKEVIEQATMGPSLGPEAEAQIVWPFAGHMTTDHRLDTRRTPPAAADISHAFVLYAPGTREKDALRLDSLIHKKLLQLVKNGADPDASDRIGCRLTTTSSEDTPVRDY